MMIYEAHQNDLALDMVDVGDLIRVDRARMGRMIAPYWPSPAILVRADERLAYVLPWPATEQRQRELEALIDLLQVLVGPAKLQRPVRCWRFERTRWREIDPRRRLLDDAARHRDSQQSSIIQQAAHRVLVSARRRFQRLEDRS